MRGEAIREQVIGILNRAPFRPFVIMLDSGHQVIIDHPENIAFNLGPGYAVQFAHFSVASERGRVYSTFDAVSSVAVLEDESWEH